MPPPRAGTAVRRCHRMPFGAELLADGQVRFRLWAPGARRVALCLESQGREAVLPMVTGQDGWFSLVTEKAVPGDFYRYRLDSGLRVPDPASRFQPADVHGPSQVLNPEEWLWQDVDWRGRPWEEAVIYELHVGAFSAEGNYAAVTQRLDHLVELGITAIELMPLADFRGDRNWGYDGVLLFAPDSAYGRPEDLKDLIQTAHQKGLMVFLDVVYNHFGPEGNYLHTYAPEFFATQYDTPWGKAINFDGRGSRPVRQFFIENALYWLEEYHFDGLRLDSAHAMRDDSPFHVLEELATAVKQGPGRKRHVHLVLENDHNAAHYLVRKPNGKPKHYVAQWDDDIHHSLHVLLTGETDGYYADYADRPTWYLGRCLAEGFGYQGEVSGYRKGNRRGEPSSTLPPTAFVAFLQNHDQVGNRAFGERFHALTDKQAVRAALALILLAPYPPLMFMGDEFAAQAPFYYFCDFEGNLAAAVAEGRCREFARFERFADDKVHAPTIPNPNALATFEHSKLDWDDLSDTLHRDWLAFYRNLLTVRRERIIPHLAGIQGNIGSFRQLGKRGLHVQWRIDEELELILLANLGKATVQTSAADIPLVAPFYVYPPEPTYEVSAHRLLPWSVAWFFQVKSA